MEVTVILKGGYSSISVDLLFRNLHSSRSWPKVRDFNPQKRVLGLTEWEKIILSNFKEKKRKSILIHIRSFIFIGICRLY